MKAQKSGSIINIASIAGVIGRDRRMYQKAGGFDNGCSDIFQKLYGEDTPLGRMGKGGQELGGAEGSCELRYTHTGYSLRTYTRQTGCWQEENVDNLFRNMMFQDEDREFLQSIVTGQYRGCSMADAGRAVKIYSKVYGEKNPV